MALGDILLREQYNMETLTAHAIRQAFAAITLSTEISAQVSIRSPQGVEKQSVSTKAADNYQTGMEGNWIEVAGKALRAFIDNLRNKIK